MRVTFCCRLAVTWSAAALAAGCALPTDNGPNPTPGQATKTGGYSPPPPPSAPSFPRPVDVPLEAGLDARATEVVRAATADRTDEVRRANGLEAVQEGRLADADRYVLPGLDDPSPLVRKVAAIVAGQLRVKAALPKLQAMADPAAGGAAGAPAVGYSSAGTAAAQERLAVVYALHRLGDARYTHEFEPATADPRAGVRRDACLLLGQLGNRSAIPILGKVLHTDPEPNVRLEAAAALWRLGDVAGRDALIVGLEDPYASDQMVALLGLAAPGEQHVVLDYVNSKLTDDYLEVSLVAARAAGQLGSMNGYGVALKQGLPSADPRQRALAAFAFADIGRPDCQKYLAKLLDDPVPEVRLAAAAAVLKLNAPPETR